jgi:hypothetical protein
MVTADAAHPPAAATAWRRQLVRHTQQSWWYVILTVLLVGIAAALLDDRAGWVTWLFVSVAALAVGLGVLGGVVRVLDAQERIHRAWGRGWLLALVGLVSLTVAVWLYLAGLGLNQVALPGFLGLIAWPPGWVGVAVAAGLAFCALSLAIADLLRFTEDVAERRTIELDRHGRRFAPYAASDAAIVPSDTEETPGVSARQPPEHDPSALRRVFGVDSAEIDAALRTPLLELPLTPPMRHTLELSMRAHLRLLAIWAAIGGVALAVAFVFRANRFSSLGVVIALICVAPVWEGVRRILELREDRRSGTYLQGVCARQWLNADRSRGATSQRTALRLLSGGELGVARQIANAIGDAFFCVVSYTWSDELVLEVRSLSGSVLYRESEYMRALAQNSGQDGVQGVAPS